MRGFSEFLARLRGGSADRDHARFAAVLGLNRSLASVADRRTVLELLLDEAVELFRAERGFLVEAGSDGWSVSLARSLDREPVRHPARKVSSTVVDRCLATQEGVFVEDAQESELGAAQSVADLQLRSVLCIPLVAASHVYGCLYLDHRFHTAAFRAEDLPWAQALADQGAIALRMFELVGAEAARATAAERDREQLAESLAARELDLAESADELDRATLRHPYPRIVGRSPALVRCLRVLDRVAAVEVSVLLVGESGCGKELAARALWEHGSRAEGPFVPVNVAAISPALLESELFGHVQGAFTGAESDRQGLLRHADGGVLFLDEVTEMPLEMQAKLLRALEEHEVRPVGAESVHSVDFRIVAATNRDPEQAVRDGVLREDLYYRLATVTVRVPPLRERLSDVPLLVESFLASAAAARGGEPRGADPKLVDALRRRSWPGNLRELRNEVFRLDALADGDVIAATLIDDATTRVAARSSLDLKELERWAVAEALRVTGGNKAEAARLLGISRRALYNKLGREG